jgi:UDP-N-acetyl-D-mannosaminuronic acid dehydrogenase
MSNLSRALRTGGLSDVTVAVYGLGKMGLPLAALFADRGARVRGVDIDESVVSRIDDGRAPPWAEREPDVPRLVARHGGERLTATTDGRAAAAAADVMVVVVPTVLDDAGSPDLAPVEAAARSIRDGVDVGDLVVLASTVPPGTTAGLFADALTTDELVAGEDFEVAHTPERTSSGRVLEDLTESYPQVVGGITPSGTRAAAALCETVNEVGVVEVDSATHAEAVKVFEGVYRDVNIALANELGTVCEEWGIDARAVFEAANSQPYCDLHRPGCGVGGHCIPVYPQFVTARAASTPTPLVETARAVNDRMPRHTAETVEAALSAHDRSLAAARVLLLGVTYRAGVPETRYTPAHDVADELDAGGAAVFAHDPLLDEVDAPAAATPVADPLGVDDVDAVVLVTGHEEYRRLDRIRLRERMRTPVFVDGRGFFAREELSAFDAVWVGDGRGHPRRREETTETSEGGARQE